MSEANEAKKSSTGKWVALGCLGIPLLLGACMLMSVLAFGTAWWLKPSTVSVASAPQAPVVIFDPVYPAGNTDSAYDSTDVMPSGEGCGYRAGYNSAGRQVSSGFVVTGPALVKYDRDHAYALVIPKGMRYTTLASDEIVWEYTGDDACLQSQLDDNFSSWQWLTP